MGCDQPGEFCGELSTRLIDLVEGRVRERPEGVARAKLGSQGTNKLLKVFLTRLADGGVILAAGNIPKPAVHQHKPYVPWRGVFRQGVSTNRRRSVPGRTRILPGRACFSQERE